MELDLPSRFFNKWKSHLCNGAVGVQLAHPFANMRCAKYSHDPTTHAPPQRMACSTASNNRITSKTGHFCRVFYTFKYKYINFDVL